MDGSWFDSRSLRIHIHSFVATMPTPRLNARLGCCGKSALCLEKDFRSRPSSPGGSLPKSDAFRILRSSGPTKRPSAYIGGLSCTSWLEAVNCGIAVKLHHHNERKTSRPSPPTAAVVVLTLTHHHKPSPWSQNRLQ